MHFQCPVCLVCYRNHGWLTSHIAKMHPFYRTPRIRKIVNRAAPVRDRMIIDTLWKLPDSPQIPSNLWEAPDEAPEAQQIRAEIDGLVDLTKTNRTHRFPGPAGLPLHIVHCDATIYMHIQCQQYGGIAPFHSHEAYTLAKWLTAERCIVKGINNLLKGEKNTENLANIADEPLVIPVHPAVLESYTSMYSMRKLIDQIPDGLATEWEKITADFC